jgi:hypothetical protein
MLMTRTDLAPGSSPPAPRAPDHSQSVDRDVIVFNRVPV